MATGSWLRTHRKTVITHALIVGAFLLFLFFLSEPLFDRFERVAGESQLYETTLPAATDNIQYWIDQFQVTINTLEVNGWAFIDGYDSLNSTIYIVLNSTNRSYVFDTRATIRPTVTQAFEELNLNLDYSGFAALIPARKIAGGDYTVGIYITKDDVEALQYTDRVVEF
jgi:hypothetical protein